MLSIALTCILLRYKIFKLPSCRYSFQKGNCCDVFKSVMSAFSRYTNTTRHDTTTIQY